MTKNPAVHVQEYGQSLWLDYIHRKELEDGTLKRRVEEDGIMGVTSNPSIFQKAISGPHYDDAIANLIDLEAGDIYEKLAIEDIQSASDVLRPVYDRTNGKDGFVSLEVSPLLARDTQGTIAEAKRLSEAVNRPNLMIKIPATPEGIPAIEETIAAGINVNVTLIFAVQNYVEVAEAYIRGLERRLEASEDVGSMASVASFFLSRIDSMVDAILENNIQAAEDKNDTSRVTANRALLGLAAIASAKQAYKRFNEIFNGPRFEKLREAGAQVQRPLWASTSTKNPDYSDVKYIDTLIGAHTVNTVPPVTLDSFIDHGTVTESLPTPINGELDPQEVIDRLAEVNVDMTEVTQRLQDDGVESFIQAFETLMSEVAAKRSVARTGVMGSQKMALGIDGESVQKAIKDMDDGSVNARLWNKDASLWKDDAPTVEKIKNRLGWLDIQKTIDRERLQKLQDSVKDGDFDTVVLLGMGGSSLAPEVLYQTFGRQAGFPAFLMLDSTDPARVQQIEDEVDMGRTLFIVASKSGGTIETLSFYRYFYQQTGENGAQFIAITDPGSKLEKEAQNNNFRDVFLNPADIGGRYSALSYFGMVPAALMGLDLGRLWAAADNMIEASNPDIPSAYHPGITVGAVMGALGKQGRDKVSIYSTKSIASFGNWVEQLIAESTGKEGKGLLPVVGATVGNPDDYATDRVFIYLKLADDPDVEKLDNGVRALREAGYPRVTIELPDTYAIAGEFFRWEYATAIAGHLLEVNPFDEPNVTEAKQATNTLLETYQNAGRLPTEEPLVTSDTVSLYSDDNTLNPLRELARSHNYNMDNLTELLGAQLAGTHAGDYFAVLAYFTPTAEQEELLRDLQRRIRHVTKRAVTIGFGPRYLHSTGQLHKGGPNNGIFIQLTAANANDIDIPGAPYSFGTLFDAQAAGDLSTLREHKCRTIRLHSTGEPTDSVFKLLSAVSFVEERRS